MIEGTDIDKKFIYKQRDFETISTIIILINWKIKSAMQPNMYYNAPYVQQPTTQTVMYIQPQQHYLEP